MAPASSPRSAKALLGAALIAGVLLFGAVPPASAGATPCWKLLLNDWYDGRIDHTYALRCYTEALRNLPADLRAYGSAHDDIERALQSAIAQRSRVDSKLTPATQIAPPVAAKPQDAPRVTVATAPPRPVRPRPAPTVKGPPERTTHPKIGGATRSTLAGAGSVPLPVVVLGGLALLLVVAGAAGLIAKRSRGLR